ncbi:MAG: NAD-binding protein [Chloroflexi bacterium]|nr:NAD-binding protein [Chloroflexota bacterium]
MYIIVVGGGKVGYYLSKALLAEGHEILIVEKNAVKCSRIVEELGSICVRGDGCEASTLENVGTGRADMLIAVTDEDEDNLVACQVAKHKFKVPRTIARISNPENEKIFQMLGIEVTVSSTNLILENIEREVPTHPLTHLQTLRQEGLELVEIKIPASSPVIGKQIRDLKLPPDSLLSLIIPHGKRPLVPTEDSVLQPDDHVLAVTQPDSEAELRAALTGG